MDGKGSWVLRYRVMTNTSGKIEWTQDDVTRYHAKLITIRCLTHVGVGPRLA